VLEPGAYPDLDRATLLQELAGRTPFIDGVVVSGGEPTLDPALPDFLGAIKRLGLAIKLDTNGLRPEVLARLFDRQLIDYLAIDLKTGLSRYSELDPRPVNAAALFDSVRLALAEPIAVEFRTTCIPGLVDESVIAEWGEVIRGAPLWALQQYQPAVALDPVWRDLSPYPVAGIRQLEDIARQYVDAVVVRGVG
jgi:pyruvate formate lyase activating enzyme